VERAFEHIRVEVASMRESRDLTKVIRAMEESLKELGISCEEVGIIIFDEEIDRYGSFATGGSEYERDLHGALQGHGGVRELYGYWKKGETWHRFHGEESHLPNKQVVDIPFSHGTVAMGRPGPDPFSEEDIYLLERCTEIFSLGYTRFLDFQRVEEAQKKLIDELEEELQTAHDMQMGLMPTEAPQIPGYDIVGHCIPANHVGGDFFQYFPQNDKLSISLADVTGHAMEAAVPVMMFSGILKSQMEVGGSVEDIFGRLNRSLHGTLDKRTFVCFTMGELDTETRTLHLANGGCPYPYHFRASTGEISELQLDAYPLAIRPDSEYQTIDIQLEAGDCIIFCSDGIIEAVKATSRFIGE